MSTSFLDTKTQRSMKSYGVNCQEQFSGSTQNSVSHKEDTAPRRGRTRKKHTTTSIFCSSPPSSFDDAMSNGNNEIDGKDAVVSGTTTRGRRLLRVREEKRKREYDRLSNYPSRCRVLEDACKNDDKLRAVLGDSIGDPELMKKRVEDGVRTKGRE